MKCLPQWAITLSVGLLLTACGGGSSVVIDSMGPVSSDPLPTAVEVREEISDIGLAATGLIMTDMLSTPRSRVFPNDRGETFCSGTSCEPEPAYSEPYYSAEELSTIAPDATIRVGEMKYGINNGEISGSESYRAPEEDEDWSVDYTVYGGWLSQNFFGIEQKRWRGRAQYGSVEGLETLIAFSAGTESGSNPATGSAEWHGLLVAVDATAPAQPVHGQASLAFDVADQTLDVEFSDIRGARTYTDMRWNNLEVMNGRFGVGDGSNSLSGSFYGSNHEEVGGVFERNQLIGAFGASRQ